MKVSTKLLKVVVVLLLLTALYMKLKDINLVLYENYVAENNDNRTVYEYNDEAIDLRLVWSNVEVTNGPYRLLIFIDVKDDGIENIHIENISITASSEKEYVFSSVQFPFLMYNVLKQDTHLNYSKENVNLRYYKFSDRFNFDFNSKEEFMLKINMSYEGKNINEEKQIEVKYVPFLEKVYASMF